MTIQIDTTIVVGDVSQPFRELHRHIGSLTNIYPHVTARLETVVMNLDRGLEVYANIYPGPSGITGDGQSDEHPVYAWSRRPPSGTSPEHLAQSISWEVWYFALQEGERNGRNFERLAATQAEQSRPG